MTSPKIPSDDQGSQTWEYVPAIRAPKQTSAKLLDAGGQVLSKGAAVFYRAEKKVLFHPHDLAQLDTLQSHARTLLLIDSKESLAVHEIVACLGECGGLLHWHIKLK